VPCAWLPHAHHLHTTSTYCTIQVLKSSAFHANHTLSHHPYIMFGCMNRPSCLAPHSLFPYPTPLVRVPERALCQFPTCAPFARHPNLLHKLSPQVKHIPCQPHTHRLTVYRVWLHDQTFPSCTPFPRSIPPRLAHHSLLPYWTPLVRVPERGLCPAATCAPLAHHPNWFLIQLLKSSTFHVKHTLSHHLSMVFGCMNITSCLAPHSRFPYPTHLI